MSGLPHPFEQPVRLMADDTPVETRFVILGPKDETLDAVDIRQMGFARQPKTALERLDDLEEWLTEALLFPPQRTSMPEFVCLVRSVRDRVTQIREQLEDA